MPRKDRGQSMARISTFAVCFVVVFLAAARAQNGDSGRQAYLAHCLGCHGDDGTGGGRGPNIVDVPVPRGVSKDAVRDLILKGISDAGMPAFKITSGEADAIAAYIMELKTPPSDGTITSNPAPGDPAAGESFFTGKGNCASCHMVRGRGGVLGPDLSNVAHNRKLAQIEQALLDPGSQTLQRGPGEAPSGRAVTVLLRDGQTLQGLAKNQSTFDLQLLGNDGKLHLLMKDEIAQLVLLKSLMPKVDATPYELRDLLAYLTRLTVDPNTRPTMASGAEMGAGVSFADVSNPKPGTWPTYHGNESGNRFSQLDQINANNVGKLAPGWMFSIGVPRGEGPPKRGVGRWVGLEGTPIVVDGVMYVTSVNEAFALDARSGREIWHYSRPRSQGLAGDAASGLN